LPKREFFEKELKELIVVVVDEWTKSLNKKQLNLSQKKKLIKQVKILRDQQKVDATT